MATDRARFIGRGLAGDTALTIFDGRGRPARTLRLTGKPIGSTGLRVTTVDTPAWSPDRRYIAFVTRGSGERGQVCRTMHSFT